MIKLRLHLKKTLPISHDLYHLVLEGELRVVAPSHYYSEAETLELLEQLEQEFEDRSRGRVKVEVEILENEALTSHIGERKGNSK